MGKCEYREGKLSGDCKFIEGREYTKAVIQNKLDKISNKEKKNLIKAYTRKANSEVKAFLQQQYGIDFNNSKCVVDDLSTDFSTFKLNLEKGCRDDGNMAYGAVKYLIKQLSNFNDRRLRLESAKNIHACVTDPVVSELIWAFITSGKDPDVSKLIDDLVKAFVQERKQNDEMSKLISSYRELLEKHRTSATSLGVNASDTSHAINVAIKDQEALLDQITSATKSDPSFEAQMKDGNEKIKLALENELKLKQEKYKEFLKKVKEFGTRLDGYKEQFSKLGLPLDDPAGIQKAINAQDSKIQSVPNELLSAKSSDTYKESALKELGDNDRQIVQLLQFAKEMYEGMLKVVVRVKGDNLGDEYDVFRTEDDKPLYNNSAERLVTGINHTNIMIQNDTKKESIPVADLAAITGLNQEGGRVVSDNPDFVNFVFGNNDALTEAVPRSYFQTRDQTLPFDKPIQTKIDPTEYTQVYNGGKVTTKTIFDDEIKGHLDKVLAMKFNIVLFGYGFSGSGKTYTLIGDLKEGGTEGLIHHCFRYVADKYKEGGQRGKIELDAIYELCANELGVNMKNNQLKTSRRWYYKADQKVFDPITVTSDSFVNFNKLLVNINDMRKSRFLTQKFTPNNPESSRSHMFIRFKVTQDNDQNYITFVDLAGLENSAYIKAKIVQSLDDEDEVIDQFSSRVKTLNELFNYSRDDIVKKYLSLTSVDPLEATKTAASIENALRSVKTYVLDDKKTFKVDSLKQRCEKAKIEIYEKKADKSNDKKIGSAMNPHDRALCDIAQLDNIKFQKQTLLGYLLELFNGKEMREGNPKDPKDNMTYVIKFKGLVDRYINSGLYNFNMNKYPVHDIKAYSIFQYFYLFMMLREGQFINYTVNNLLSFFELHSKNIKKQVYEDEIRAFLDKKDTVKKNVRNFFGCSLVTEMLNLYPEPFGTPAVSNGAYLENPLDFKIKPSSLTTPALISAGKKTAFVMICAVRREQKNMMQTLFALHYAASVSSAGRITKTGGRGLRVRNRSIAKPVTRRKVKAGKK